MKTRVYIGILFTACLTLLSGTTAHGQGEPKDWNQGHSCPGWNNPNSFNNFTSWGTEGGGGYSGQGGGISSSNRQCPDPLSGQTGLQWNTTFNATQLNAGGALGSGSCYGSSIPDHTYQFRIMGQNTTELNGTDPNTGSHLKYVPTQFNTFDTGDVINTNLTKSIRIGDGCQAGSGWTSTNGAAALYYTVAVTAWNAMFYLYYSIVAQAPGHNESGNPAFIIRVMKKNNSGQWVQISDTLAYYISSTASGTSQSGGVDCPNMSPVTLQTGYPAANDISGNWYSQGSGSSAVLYKNWSKVCINLAEYIGDTLQLQAIISDCFYNAHYAYAYIAGECRQMKLNASGCPAGRSTTVGTITAPRGMEEYVWQASRFGQTSQSDLGPNGPNSHYSFRTLASGTEAEGHHIYEVQASDFQLRYHSTPGMHDSIPTTDVEQWQTFRCKMKSRIDPSKPFYSALYVDMQNTKPTMDVAQRSYCNGDVYFKNDSYVPGDQTLVDHESTRWVFYPNAQCTGTPIDTMYGDTVRHNFPNTEVKGVEVRTFTQDPTCWSEAIYPIRPLEQPKTGMTITDHVLCDADSTTLIDTTTIDLTLSPRRQWIFLRDTSALGPDAVYDTITGYFNDQNVVRRSFTHKVEPIELKVRNGLYYRNPENLADTIWCERSAFDTVQVFVHPDLEVTGDTIVCNGDLTEAVVHAVLDSVPVDSCTYEWSLVYGQIPNPPIIPEGDTLRVAPYADTAVYYVRVTSPRGCMAWDSVYVYLVHPKLKMFPTDGRICPGDTAMLVGLDADHFTWTASPLDTSLSMQDSLDTVRVTPMETTVYTMVGHGSNNCDASPLTTTVTIVPLPVPTLSTTPGFVDTDDPTMTLRDVSPYGVRTKWLFNNSELVEGREVQHTFEEAVGKDSVYVLMTSFNEMDCPASRTFGIPVTLFTMWMPNIFTPGSEDENSRFRLYTNNDYELFHLYIYNRQGQLVYETTDPKFEWDGTYMGSGDKCPQGAYVYFCNYRKPNTPNLITQRGSITLVR